MRIREPYGDGYWQAVVELNDQEWPRIRDAFAEDDWPGRPIRRWFDDHIGYMDGFFSWRGEIYFRSATDAKWFQMVWNQDDPHQNT